MKKLDPRLRHVIRQQTEGVTERDVLSITGALALAERVGLVSEAAQPATVEVLVRCAGAAQTDDLRAVGMDVRFVIRGAQTIASGAVPLDALEQLSSLPFVERIESSRPMLADLDISGEETRAVALHQAASPVRGAGVIVGIVDSGIDYTHPSFRRVDGSSRILFLWDQGAPNSGSMPYGREYTKADLDAALALTHPFAHVPHRDSGDGHGTHVAGIAAGNEGNSGGAFDGIAPDADLIIVALETEVGRTLGRSVRAFEAFTYIVRRAAGRPVAINMSQGMNGGGHSGETVLETALDNLLQQPNIVVVKSAGNEQQQNIHAGGQIAQGQTVALSLDVRTNNSADDVIEVWYSGDDAISIAIQPPGAAPLPFVHPGNTQEFQTPAGNQVNVDFDLDADGTGDTQATIILSSGSGAFIQPGMWKILLRGDQITEGRYDAWVERTRRDISGEQTRFAPDSVDATRTISIPGTARRVITVGSYVTRPKAGFSAPQGQVSAFSSRGPTRYGLLKPEIAAPGEWIISARASDSLRPAEPDALHTSMPGTSMAAPHVSGAAALILSVRPNLTCEQVKQIMMKAAPRDGFAAGAPDIAWGSGKLDAAAAVEQARAARFPRISNVHINGVTIAWETDIPTTGAVRFHTHRRRLQLGKSLGSRATLTPGTQHSLTLSDLADGTYFCEILAFSGENWLTADDNGGLLYKVQTTTAEVAVPERPAVTPSVPVNAPAASVPVSSPEEELRLDIAGITLVPADDSAPQQAETRLRAHIPFRLVGTTARQVAAAEAAYYIQVLAYETQTGQTAVLAATQQRLQSNVLAYEPEIEFNTPEIGHYRIMGTVVIGDSNAVDISVGPELNSH